jgi:hypothetical protein
LSMGNAMKTLAQHLHRCALDRLGCVSISGVRTLLCIGLANPLRSSCNARNATFYNTAMGLIAISFSFPCIEYLQTMKLQILNGAWALVGASKFSIRFVGDFLLLYKLNTFSIGRTRFALYF